VVALLGEVAQRRVDNSRALGFEPWTRLRTKAHRRFEQRASRPYALM
jgi:hypothetical protein